MAVTNVVFWMILSGRLDDKYGFDHTFDHLRLRTVRTRCDGTYEKVFCSDTKAPKNTEKPWFYKHFGVRVQEAGGSNPLTPTTKSLVNAKFTRLFLFPKIELTTPLTTYGKSWFYKLRSTCLRLSFFSIQKRLWNTKSKAFLCLRCNYPSIMPSLSSLFELISFPQFVHSHKPSQYIIPPQLGQFLKNRFFFLCFNSLEQYGHRLYSDSS